MNNEWDLIRDGVPLAEFALLMISAMDMGFFSLARVTVVESGEGRCGTGGRSLPRD